MKLKNLISKLLAVNLFIQPFIPAKLFSEKPPSFLENIVNYEKEVIYLKENLPCTLKVNIKTNEIVELPNLSLSENEKKALKFAWYVKSDFLQILKALENATKNIDKIKKNLINYSWNILVWSGPYKEGARTIADDVFEDSDLYAYENLPSSLEERLWQDVVRKGKEFWESLKGDNPSLERIIMNYLGLKGSLKELERYEQLEEIKRKRYVRELWKRRYATLDYEMRNTLEILAKEISKFWQNSGISGIIYKLFHFEPDEKQSFFTSANKRLYNIFDEYLYGRVGAYPGWVTPTALWLFQVMAGFNYIYDFMKANNIDLNRFSVKDAWKIYKNRENFLELLDIFSIPVIWYDPVVFKIMKTKRLYSEYGGVRPVDSISSWSSDDIFNKIVYGHSKKASLKRLHNNYYFKVFTLPFAYIYEVEGFWREEKIKKTLSHETYFDWVFRIYVDNILEKRDEWYKNRSYYLDHIKVLTKSTSQLASFLSSESE